MEADGVERLGRLDSEEVGAGAFELGVVEAALFAFEFDDDFVLGARGEVGRGLGFGAAEEEVADAAVEAGERCRVGFVILTAEGGLVAEEAGLGEGEEAPEVGEAVFDGRAGQDNPVFGA